MILNSYCIYIYKNVYKHNIYIEVIRGKMLEFEDLILPTCQMPLQTVRGLM